MKKNQQQNPHHDQNVPDPSQRRMSASGNSSYFAASSDMKSGSVTPSGMKSSSVTPSGMKTNGMMLRRRKKRRNRQQWILFVLLLVVLTGLVWYGCSRSGSDPVATTTSSIQSSGNNTTQSSTGNGSSTDSASATTTLSSSDTSTGESSATETSLQTSATLSESERQARLDAAAAAVMAVLDAAPQGRFAVYFQNLASGESWAYQAEEPFVAASSIKLGINTYLYTKIDSGEIDPDEQLTYDSRAYPTGDYEGGTGTIQGMPDGSAFSVRETSGLSIRISDNCATNMVIRRLGGIDAINPWLNDISGKVDYRVKVSYTNYGGQAQNGRHRTCALDLGLQAVRLYELWSDKPAVYEPLMDDLSHTEFDFGIQKGIPEGIRVAHKIGTNGTYSAENDVGLVFTTEPFALCVMTEMASASQAHEIQADIASIFYTHVAELP